jgi:hypothetical protein
MPRFKSASLEGRITPERDSASLGGWTPPLARGPASVGGRATPRASFRLARGVHGPAASIPASPAGAFNALIFVGVQVKGESTPLRAWESCPGTTPPTPVARQSPPLCDAMRHGQQPPRGTVPPTPVRPAHCTLEKGRQNPRRDDARLLHARTGRRRDVRPVGAVTSIANSPVRPSPPPRRHPDHCITIPDTMEACGDGTLPRQPLCLVRPHVNGTLESSRGRPSNEQPLRHPLEAAPGRAQDTP